MRTRPLFVLCVVVTAGCAANAAPTLSPVAAAAFTNTRVIRVLDLVRDTAISAHEQQPPLLSEPTTRKVVLYHQSTLKIIDATTTGWRGAVSTGLEELLRNIPNGERQLLAPYITLVKAILAEVP